MLCQLKYVILKFFTGKTSPAMLYRYLNKTVFIVMVRSMNESNLLTYFCVILIVNISFYYTYKII